MIDVLAKPDLEETIKVPIVDNLFPFLTNSEHLKLALRWIDKSYIFKEENEEAKLFELS